METTIMGLYGDYRVYNYWGYIGDNGKENGNYSNRVIWGL